MRILITGMTRQQCGIPPKLQYVLVADMFAQGLRYGGHEVRVAPLERGDDDELRPWDVVVLGLSAPQALTPWYMYPVLRAVAAAERLHKPLLFYVDDWQYPALVSGFDALLQRPEAVTKPFFSTRLGYGWAREHRAELVETIGRLVEQSWPPTLFPAYAWGDSQVLTRVLPQLAHGSTFTADPTPFCAEYRIPVEPDAWRERAWILGTAADHRRWMGRSRLTWPVQHYGTRSAHAPEYVPESHLVGLYGRVWGVLSPFYPRLADSGWWRGRFVFALRAGAVLGCDPREAAVLGAAYTRPLTEIEQLPDGELRAHAAAQEAAFRPWMATPEETAARLHSAVQQACDVAAV